MKIATWNVNSIKARLDHVTTWLASQAPDVLFLQELKGEDFPAAAFDALGYASVSVSQKAYNGVATLVRGPTHTPITPVLTHLPGDDADQQARYLELTHDGVRFINIYLPNGNPVGTDKFLYKLSWMDRLIARVRALREAQIPFVIGGDFNVIPEDRDCFDPALWREDALFHPETLKKFRALLYLGLFDAFRVQNPTADQAYTFWDYQAGCWPKNQGIRIDHFLLSPLICDCLTACSIDRTPRGWDKASDHTPLILEFLPPPQVRG